MTSHITVVGSINADLSVRVNRHPKPGETIFGTGGSISPGGKGANQAVAAARGGVRVAMAGAVGDDEAGRRQAEALEAAGVDIAEIARRAEMSRTTVYKRLDTLALED